MAITFDVATVFRFTCINSFSKNFLQHRLHLFIQAFSACLPKSPKILHKFVFCRYILDTISSHHCIYYICCHAKGWRPGRPYIVFVTSVRITCHASPLSLIFSRLTFFMAYPLQKGAHRMLLEFLINKKRMPSARIELAILSYQALKY
jgi:hypothetical protein